MRSSDHRHLLPRRALGVVVTAAVLVAMPLDAAGQLVRSRPPPGFEQAAAPQPAVVDIWFDGERVGTANALLAPGEIIFDDPRAVAAILPGEIDIAAVADALSGPLETHSDRLCAPGAPPDCGVLAPEVAGVIADSARFRVDVFVGADYRATGPLEPRFVPRPAWSPSLVQRLSLTASAVSGADTLATLAAGSALASGPGRILADYGVASDEGVFVDDLIGQLEHRRWRFEAGLARAAVVPLLADRRFAGGRVATTLDTRLDREAVSAQPLTVSLARRSQVEILRDGRLLSVQTLPAGTAQLDTAPLPGGAYDVTLRISGPTGVRQENRFVVKSAALPPDGAPSLTVEGGLLVTEEESGFPPELGDTPFVHGGVRYRLGEAFAVGSDLAVTPREAVASLQALGVLPGLDVTADVFAGTDRAAGVGLGGRGEFGGVAYGVAGRWITGDPGPGTIDTRDSDDVIDVRFVPGRERDRLTAFADDETELNLSLSYQIAGGPRLGLRGFWRRGGGETYAVGPNLTWYLGRIGEARADLVAEATVTDEEDVVFARLRLGFDTGPWRSWADGGYSNGDAGGATATAYLGRQLVDTDNHRLDMAGRIDRDGRVTSLGGELAYRGTPGRLQLTATHDRGSGENRYGLQAGTTLAASLGGVGLVGRRGGSSALVARLAPARGVAADAVFEVVVDERARRRLRPGEAVAVPLPAYDAYSVRLKQVDGPLVAYDGRAREVSLYPGSVASERWRIRPLVTVFARLVDASGAPLGDARLDTVPPTFTDARGYFQAELGSGRPGLTATAGARTCRLELPPLGSTTGYRRLGDVPCRPTASPTP